MINVTKSFLPNLEEYKKYIDGIWDRAWLTNYGPLNIELEEKLKKYLVAEHLTFCTNGTIAIQVALKALNITGDVITTPFSYVATTNSILWENCNPIFVDIRPDDFCIDHRLIEEKITSKTQAILAVHVYGLPCHVKEIEAIAKKHHLKVIYDAAHAFGVNYNGKSLLTYGDISTCSFHATKIFHTIEGGCIISNNEELAKNVKLSSIFGHVNDDYFQVGINGKNSEFHAAMGLCVLPKIDLIIEQRKYIFDQYDSHILFNEKVRRPTSVLNFDYNFAYYPVIFETEELLLKVISDLKLEKINARRYFYPSLNKLNFVTDQPCPVSEDISKRVLCLPLYHDLADTDIERVSNIINKTLN